MLKLKVGSYYYSEGSWFYARIAGVAYIEKRSIRGKESIAGRILVYVGYALDESGGDILPARYFTSDGKIIPIRGESPPHNEDLTIEVFLDNLSDITGVFFAILEKTEVDGGALEIHGTEPRLFTDLKEALSAVEDPRLILRLEAKAGSSIPLPVKNSIAALAHQTKTSK